MKRKKAAIRRLMVILMSVLLITSNLPLVAFADELSGDPEQTIIDAGDETVIDESTSENEEQEVSDDASDEETKVEVSSEDAEDEEVSSEEEISSEEEEEEISSETEEEEITSEQEDEEEETSEEDEKSSEKKPVKPTEEDEEDLEDEDTEYPAFDQNKTVNGVVITVKAPEGVFPEGAELSVSTVSSSEQEAVDAAVEDVRDDDVNVAVSYSFDIKVIDPKTGEEIQPADGQKVEVSFALAYVADENLDTQVYHVKDEEADGMTAEKLAVVDESDASVVVETDGFSVYQVEFTYNNLQYVLAGDSEISLADILESVGLVGEVSGVEISNTDLFSADNASGAWVVSAHQAFSTTEWMKVTINGVVYEITVTDDQEITTWAQLQTAITNASSGAIITLTRDLTAGEGDERLRIYNKNLTLDLGGKTLDRHIGEFPKDDGGVIYVDNSSVTIKNGTIKGGNTSGYGGGIYFSNSSSQTSHELTIENCTISDNKAVENGGGIYAVYKSETRLENKVIIKNSHIEKNVSGSSGGGIYLDKGIKASMNDCYVKNNEARNDGGGIFVSAGDFSWQKTDLHINSIEITGNTAGNDGGGIEAFGKSDVYIQGKVVVKDNKGQNNRVDNYFLRPDFIIEVDGALTEGTDIGVRKKIKGSYGVITRGLNGNGKADLFKADDSSFMTGHCSYYTDGEAYIGSKRTLEFDHGEGGTGLMNPCYCMDSSVFVFPNPSFVPPAGKTFSHWVDSKGRTYYPNTYYIISENKKYYAQYTSNYYINEEGTSTTIYQFNSVAEDSTQLSDDQNNGLYVVQAYTDVVCENALDVSGDVKIVLFDGATLKVPKGIKVSEGNSLTIYCQSEGTGKLIAGPYEEPVADDRKFAGIGSTGSNEQCGTIKIVGGGIYAQGNMYGAGIGGGEGSDGGNITILGGNITAVGGQAAAGIGGGRSGNGGTISISGGTIKATGYVAPSPAEPINGGAGIGGGSEGKSGEISITGGVVEANGGYHSAGIGGGAYKGGGTISISGGQITANGGYKEGDNQNAGIGDGQPQTSYEPSYDTVVTLGWTEVTDYIIANGGYAAKLNKVKATEDFRIENESNKIQLDNERYIQNIGALKNKKIVPYGDTTFSGHSLVLSGKVGVRFRVDNILQNAESGNIYMTFDISDGNSVTRTDTVQLSDAEHIGNGSYWFSCKVDSLEIGDTITATLHWVENGKQKTISDDYSVKRYCDYIREHSEVYSSELVNLVTALHDYGYYMEKSGWLDKRDHQGISKAAKPLQDEDIQAAKNAVADLGVSKDYDNTGIEDVKISLALNDETQVYVFFKPVEGAHVTTEGYKEVELGGNTYYRWATPIISAANLGERYYFAVLTDKDTDENYATVSVCAMSYVNAVLDDNSSFPEEKKKAMTAYYNYYAAISKAINK